MKKILLGLMLSLMMAANIFADDWVKYKTIEDEEVGAIDVYFDYDSTEPFDIKNESIRFFLLLQDIYEDVEVHLENIDEDWGLCSEAIEHNCYAIVMKCGNYYTNIYIHDNDEVTIYTYHVEDEE